MTWKWWCKEKSLPEPAWLRWRKGGAERVLVVPSDNIVIGVPFPAHPTHCKGPEFLENFNSNEHFMNLGVCSVGVIGAGELCSPLSLCLPPPHILDHSPCTISLSASFI
jgi:hypothetical protein